MTCSLPPLERRSRSDRYSRLWRWKSGELWSLSELLYFAARQNQSETQMKPSKSTKIRTLVRFPQLPERLSRSHLYTSRSRSAASCVSAAARFILRFPFNLIKMWFGFTGFFCCCSHQHFTSSDVRRSSPPSLGDSCDRKSNTMMLPRPRAAVHDYQKVHACELIHRVDEYCPLAIMLVLTERLDADAWIGTNQCRCWMT